MKRPQKPRAKKRGPSDSNDAQLLRKLKQLWGPLQKKDLATRLATGKLLNKRFGDPGKRQKYGAGIMRKISKTTGLDEGEISRLRRFAKRFSSLDDLFKRHPKATTWSVVKGLLADKAKPKDDPGSEDSEAEEKSEAEDIPTEEEPEAQVEVAAEQSDLKDASPASHGTDSQDAANSILDCLQSATEKLQLFASSEELRANRERIVQAAMLALEAANNLLKEAA